MEKFIVRVPATSANLGPGFDCLGLALQLYNDFEVEPWETTTLEGVEERFLNEENLFLQAYRQAGGNIPVKVTFRSRIPVARGLGSSAALLTAGACAAQHLRNGILDREALFALASQMEGHPDNAAPCVYGGLTASGKGEDGSFFTASLPLSKAWRFTLLIPDFEVSTHQARAVLPESYPRRVAVQSAGRAVLMARALETGSLDLLQKAARDELHEPYRRKLIPHYEEVRSLCERDVPGVLVISGSGSTLLYVSQKPLSSWVQDKIGQVPGRWTLLERQPSLTGAAILTQ